MEKLLYVYGRKIENPSRMHSGGITCHSAYGQRERRDMGKYCYEKFHSLKLLLLCRIFSARER